MVQTYPGNSQSHAFACFSSTNNHEIEAEKVKIPTHESWFKSSLAANRLAALGGCGDSDWINEYVSDALPRQLWVT